MLYCVGRNYVEHIQELGNVPSEEMVLFSKPPTALLSGDTLCIPSFTNDLHYECEVVLHIAKDAKAIPRHLAWDYVDAVSLGIDFTARDLQSKLKKDGLPWEKAKAFDNAAAIGTWLPKTATMHTSHFLFSLYKNKQIAQQGNTAMMIYDIPSILAEISTYFTLKQGDVVFTGTPKGVAACKPQDLLEGYLFEQQLLQIKIA